MKRRIIAVCRSKKRMRPTVAQVLDRYLWRIGDRTWSGYASNACLRRITADLRARVSRNASVALFEQGRTIQQKRPIALIGSRTRFSDDGLCPVSTRTLKETRGVPPADAMRALLPFSALFHDLGKGTTAFQEKLRRAIDGGPPEADPVRHEIWSAYFLDACVAQGASADEFFRRCFTADLDFEAAQKDASDRSKDTYTCASPPPNNPASDPHLELPAIAKMADTRLTAIADIILTHHRLAFMANDLVSIAPHVQKAEDDPHILPIAVFSPYAAAQPLWNSVSWRNWLAKDARRCLALCPDDLPDVALLCRTAFMIADHIGSSQKQPLGCAAGDAVLLANTHKNDDGTVPADDLEVHTRRVRRACYGAAEVVANARTRFPRLTEDDIPSSVRAPSASDKFFAWQAAAAKAASETVSSREGGFFACLMAGTGTGKTRGAPTVLTAVALNDANPERRGLRFCLGLGLRTLASQSGREYVRDLEFSTRDVVTMVGGEVVRAMNDDADEEHISSEASGSADRLADLDAVFAEYVDDPEVHEYDAFWEEHMPYEVHSLLNRSDGKTRTLRRMLAAPVLIATVDHIMSVTDARKSRHLPAALRVLSGDLILDEIDQYGPEDLAALSRLAFWVGVGGGRLIVMSATVSSDIVADLHASYSGGWAHHAAVSGVSAHVNALVSGDKAESVRTNKNGEDFAEVLNAARTAVCDRLEASPPFRIAQALPTAGDDPSPEIWSALARLHDLHAQNIDGKAVSAGLIRITRIEDLLSIAEGLMKLPDRDGEHTVFVCLHARMLRCHRDRIETALKAALTRKGTAPNKGLAEFLQSQAPHAWNSDVLSLRLVVMASPVIETGNDLDFDFAVIDPLDARSIVQTAGRVNRHRCATVSAPNVEVLCEPLVTMSEVNAGALAKPGVETKPNGQTGVSGVKLEEAARYPSSFVRMSDKVVIDARWLLDDAMAGIVTIKERELRERFRDGEGVSTGLFRRVPQRRLSATFTLRRRFRRKDKPDILIEARSVCGCPRFRARLDQSANETVPVETHYVAVEDSRFVLTMGEQDVAALLENAAQLQGLAVTVPGYWPVDSPDGVVFHDAFGVLKG